MTAQQKKHAVSTTTFVIMSSVALLFDGIIAAPKLLDFIPVLDFLTVPLNFMVGILASVWAWLTFYVWFKLHGISFVSPKKILAFPAAFLIKIFPFLGVLPAWTGAVVLIFLITRGEEALAVTLEKTAAVTGAASKMAGAAAKIPGMSKSLKQGIERTSVGAQNVSQLAREKAQQVRSMKEQGQLGDGAAGRGISPNKGSTAVLGRRGVSPNKGSTAVLGRRGVSPNKGSTPPSAAGRGVSSLEKGATDNPPASERSAPFVNGGSARAGVVAPPSTQPKQGDIGAQPVFRQTPQEAPAQTQNAEGKGGGVPTPPQTETNPQATPQPTQATPAKPEYGTSANKQQQPQAHKNPSTPFVKGDEKTPPPQTPASRPNETKPQTEPTKATPSAPASAPAKQDEKPAPHGTDSAAPQGIKPMEGEPLTENPAQKTNTPIAPSQSSGMREGNEEVPPREKTTTGQARGNGANFQHPANNFNRGSRAPGITGVKSGPQGGVGRTNISPNSGQSGQKMNSNKLDLSAFRKATEKNREKLKEDLAEAIDAIQKGKELP